MVQTVGINDGRQGGVRYFDDLCSCSQTSCFFIGCMFTKWQHYHDFFFFPFSPQSPPVHSCVFFVVGSSSCGMWDAASAWFDEQCHVRAQDSNQRNTGPPAAERTNLTIRPRGQPPALPWFEGEIFGSLISKGHLLVIHTDPVDELVVLISLKWTMRQRLSIPENSSTRYYGDPSLRDVIHRLGSSNSLSNYFCKQTTKWV